MAFQTGSQVNAALGRTDFTPFLQGALQGAQGQARGAENIAQGLAGLGQQAAAGMREQYKEAKELKLEERKYKDTIASGMKVLDVLSKIPDIPDSVKKLLPEFTQGLGNPNVSLSEQAASANMLTNIFGSVLSSGLKTTMENSADNAAARYANAVTESQGRDFSMLNEVSPTAKLRGQQLAANLAKTKSETYENLANRTKPVANVYTTADEARKAGEAANPGLSVQVENAPGGFQYRASQPLAGNPFVPKVTEELFTLNKTAVSAPAQIKGIDQQISLLKQGKVNVGFTGEIEQGLAKIRGLLGDEKARGSVTNTQLLESLLGNDLIKAISNAGLTTRSMDTPKELENLRIALTGSNKLEESTLLAIANLRRKNLVAIVDERNKLLKSGALNQLSAAYGGGALTEITLDEPPADGSADKYVVGQTYIDANGEKAVYQGKGVFK